MLFFLSECLSEIFNTLFGSFFVNDKSSHKVIKDDYYKKDLNIDYQIPVQYPQPHPLLTPGYAPTPPRPNVVEKYCHRRGTKTRLSMINPEPQIRKDGISTKSISSENQISDPINMALDPLKSKSNDLEKDLLLSEKSDNSEKESKGIKGSQPLVIFDRVGLLKGSKSASDNSVSVEKVSIPSTPKGSPTIISRKTKVYDHNHLPLILSKELILQENIGGGGFGQVLKALWKGTPVAVKLLQTNGGDQAISSKMLQSFEEEVNLLAQLRHPNICLLLGVCLDSNHRYIVTELVSRGSLWDVLRTPNLIQSNGPLFWPNWAIKKVLEGAGRGLIYMHSHNPPIIHRDLKSANILLDDSFNVKICDFGLAKLRDISTVMTANVGTLQWMAPEVLKGNSYNEKADIFSLSLVTWEMMTGLCPYEGMKQLEIALSVVNYNLRPSIPQNCTPEQNSFLRKSWANIPEDRYSAEELVNEASHIFP